MSASKVFDKLAIILIIIALIASCALMYLGLTDPSFASNSILGYEARLFDTSKVHQIDIVMNDWDGFIESCENEEYASCNIAIDGEKYSNVAIRAKGNTSLSSVKSLGSERYSFKIEFDHYEDEKSYYGLDKLCLNNLIQDNTMMKDYLVYQTMNEFGVDAPLCSYVYITVNGEDWGLYLAVEAVEDSFLQRNYGNGKGELYKPDSMSFGGGRGNGKDFNPEDFNTEIKPDEAMPQMPEIGESEPKLQKSDEFKEKASETTEDSKEEYQAKPEEKKDFNPGNMPDLENFDHENMPTPGPGKGPGFGAFSEDMNIDFGDFDPDKMPFDIQEMPEENTKEEASQDKAQKLIDNMPQMQGFGAMGSNDVKLQYIDDDPASYSNIFDNAKTDISDKDKKRLIASLKSLSKYDNLESVLDIDEVLRYFVVHNFVCNGDSYTGSMIHNYYLYEENGQMSMIPWDYNLAFGSFQSKNASSSINSLIDNPLSGASVDDRPMLAWIFSDSEYTDAYHELFESFIEEYINSGKIKSEIERVREMIRPYVEKDPTKFCSLEEFDTGVNTISKFISLRAEAVTRQLNNDSSIVDTGDLNLSDMGTMSMGKESNFGSFQKKEEQTKPKIKAK